MSFVPLPPETIRLNGDPLKWSLSTVFNSCREVANAAYLSLPFLAAAAVHGDTTNNGVWATLGVAIGVGLDSLLYRPLNEAPRLKRIFGEKHGELYVVKDLAFAYTSPENMKKARDAVTDAKLSIAFESVWFTLLASGPFAYSVASIAGQVPMNGVAAGISAFFLNSMLNEFGNLNRFQNVVNRKWVITDTPKPETVLEKKPSAWFSLPPQPAAT